MRLGNEKIKRSEQNFWVLIKPNAKETHANKNLKRNTVLLQQNGIALLIIVGIPQKEEKQIKLRKC